MPPKSVFRQPGVQHFQVVHRSQRDPLIHDPEASKHVLKPVQRSNLKGKSRADLEQLLSPSDLAHDDSRANIGEASLYGVYYDDTEYDYMQHLKPVGLQEDGVESMWLEAPSKSKGKSKTRDPITLLDLPEGSLASQSELPRNYESQEHIPTSISGFQPDMDPHLRQVLEALEDDAFVDDGLEDDFFGELVAEGERAPDEDLGYDFREEGIPDDEGQADDPSWEDDEGGADQSWEARFARFKREQKSASQAGESEGDTYSEGGDTVGTLPRLPVIGGKRRRKGTSDASGYSMSSSSMWRNEHLTVLDERFDQMEREYADSDEEDEEFSLDDLDEAPDLIASRDDFESMMDEFLEKYEVVAGKMRPVLPGNATDKLDAVRRALGEAKIREDADESGSEDDDILMPLSMDDKKDSWDCETILTTYSNLENHPRLIKARNNNPVPKIRLDPKTGLPFVEGRPTMPPEPKPSETDVGDDSEPARVTITRSKNETSEEKRARKQAVKAERQARRSEKKTTRESFSKEVKRQVQSLTDKEKTKVRKL